MIPIICVLIGTAVGVVYGLEHWREFGSQLNAVTFGGTVGAVAGGVAAMIIAFFNSLGRGIAYLIGQSNQRRFWEFFAVGALIGCAILNCILTVIMRKEGVEHKLIVDNLFKQPLWSFDVSLWLTAFTSVWYWYVLAVLPLGLIAILVSFDTSEGENSEPWYVTLSLVLGLVILAFPPTFILGAMALGIFIVGIVAFAIIVVFYEAAAGTGGFVKRLHTKPIRFSFFYSFIGGASGTFVAIQMGAQEVQVGSVPVLAIGWIAGSFIAIAFAVMVRRTFGLQWEYQTA